VRVRWDQLLAWRMRRQLLDPRGSPSTAEVVQRLCGVQAQVPSAAELAVAVRQDDPRPGLAEEALASRELMRTWAMRGTLHLLVPHDAGAYLALLADLRSWERPSWQRNFGVNTDDMAALADAAASALHGRVLTRDQLVAELLARTGSRHLKEQLRSGWGAVLKPLAWMGHLCNGPGEGGRVTFTRPDTWVSGWRGLPPTHEAAKIAIRAYLRAYGPATSEAFDGWLTRGMTSKKKVREWFSTLDDELIEVDVEGNVAHLLAADADELAATAPGRGVRLLPAFDQYVLGPGTGDTRVIASARRSQVSRAAGWISPVVLAGGRVAGVWNIDDATLAIELFDEAGKPDRKALDAEAERIGRFVDRELQMSVQSAE
jgi:hypothetical protein